ncbi:hypothetical protein [Clostridium beijerinckii]|uniref:hypothetical protein n=1 Tax=Clostridium beijerinckii TaxID=1520 RepID=UPI00098C4BA2|nr:hypothetical protein [Clostridium beijerinckii]MBA8937252.1 hypothetical protein [Clostridium beijerinckii]NRU40282.1 hypothetical protein [Clostridium beijerinckii]NSA96441.1 hypothetical protein [Clostridium beijerinckii]OOM60652.1 hypothetical protein CLOBI_29400 [Clostridium beijerinckii]OOM68574.1 hypothetical protein CLBEIC_32310 [Clostridium beijerinckii]
MSKEIDELKSIAGDYKTWALQARKKFIDLRLRQDVEIRNLYIKLTRDISKELKKGGLSPISKKKLQQIYSALKKAEDNLNGQLTINFEKYTRENIEAATGYSKAITIDVIGKSGLNKITASNINKVYFRVNERAVEAIWSRTQNGLYLSDRIWSKAQKYRKNMADVIQAAVAEGQDCTKTARALEQYVLKGKKTLASEYPNMMARIGNRVPSDVSYEALRLARTEMTSAFGEATLSAAKVSPSCRGVKYILSASHPKPDICDDITGTDKHGLGIGVYPVDEAPIYPFHPNCLCITTTVNERPEDFVQRLKRWDKDPTSEPSIESWYQDVYKKMNNI